MPFETPDEVAQWSAFDLERDEMRRDLTRTRDDLLVAIALALGLSPGAEIASFKDARTRASKLGLYP